MSLMRVMLFVYATERRKVVYNVLQDSLTTHKLMAEIQVYERWDIKPEDFGPLWPYVDDDSISDVELNCNCSELWITHL